MLTDRAVVVATAPERAMSRHRVRHWFYIGAGIFVILLSFAGFGPSLIDQSRRFAPPSALVIAHGATALAWMLLFVTQAALAATGRVELHRRLGWVGPLLAAAVIALGYATTIDGALRVSDLSGDVTRFLSRPGAPPPTEEENLRALWGALVVLINFTLLIVAGLLFRHRPEVHKRIMVLALLPLAFEAMLHLSGVLTDRIPVSRSMIGIIDFVVGVLLAASVAIHDKVTRGRIHPASVWVPILIYASVFLVMAVLAPSSVGLKVASWMVR